jgi:hypothetical protein
MTNFQYIIAHFPAIRADKSPFPGLSQSRKSADRERLLRPCGDAPGQKQRDNNCGGSPVPPLRLSQTVGL